MGTVALVFQEVSELVTDETSWLKRRAIGHLSAADSAVKGLGRVEQAALGAFCGSFDLAVAANGIVRESQHLRRNAAAGVSLVRPTFEWYMRGMWLRHSKNTDATAKFVSYGNQENKPKPRKSFDDLLLFTEDVTSEASDKFYAVHIVGHFGELRRFRQLWNNQIHGGPKAMLETVSEESVANRYNFSMLNDTCMTLGRIAFWTSVEIMRIASPKLDSGIVLKRMDGFEKKARDFGYVGVSFTRHVGGEI